MAHQNLLKKEKFFTARDLIDYYLRKDVKDSTPKQVLEIFEEHNAKVNSLIGDIPVQRGDHRFISGFEYYLKTERKCNHNSAKKYIVNFAKIIRIAFANEWISRDPFRTGKEL